MSVADNTYLSGESKRRYIYISIVEACHDYFNQEMHHQAKDAIKKVTKQIIVDGGYSVQTNNYINWNTYIF